MIWDLGPVHAKCTVVWFTWTLFFYSVCELGGLPHCPVAFISSPLQNELKLWSEHSQILIHLNTKHSTMMSVLHNASDHNSHGGCYSRNSFVYVSWGIIIESVQGGLIQNRAFTFYCVPNCNLVSDTVDLIYRVRSPGMCSRVLTAGRTDFLWHSGLHKNKYGLDHFVRTVLQLKQWDKLKNERQRQGGIMHYIFMYFFLS